MNTRYYILTLLSVITLSIFSQTVEYTYDKAGNRLKREIIQFRSATVSGQEEDEETEEVIYSGKIDQSDIRIYPNPTKGILKIEIIRLSEDTPIHITLHDMSGRMLINKPNAAPFTELNLSDQPAGMYILKIFSDDGEKYWKIIKE